MFNKNDIQAVKDVCPKLTNMQADEMLGFLSDVYGDKSYKIDNGKLFEAAQNLMFPEAV